METHDRQEIGDARRTTQPGVMNVMAFAALAVSAALVAGLPVPAINQTGPYRGVVEQGETDRHEYDNHPRLGGPCYQSRSGFRVTLTYRPQTDTVALRAGDKESTGVGGHAEVVLGDGDTCKRFSIEVTGAAIEDRARYKVEVEPAPHPDTQSP